jgi:2'-5' RNA ligase
MGTPNWFIALPCPGAGWYGPLRAEMPPALRPFHPDDLHLTLAFLGGCGEASARAAWSVAVDLLDGWAPIATALGPIEPMGPARRGAAFAAIPTTGWTPLVATLHRVRADALDAAGARPDTRRPHPHVTVGRLRRTDAAGQRDVLEWCASRGDREVQVGFDAVALYTWSPVRGTSGAASFRTVASARLGGCV